MTDEQWLREGLADAVPEPPANPDRARSAERLARRRRRTTTLAVLGSAGAVAAVSVLGVSVGTVKSQSARAMAALRSSPHLQREDDDHE